MSLATRCTACDTAFRVVQDQLKVSGGWVRCGRCLEVFNALEGLFDLDPEPAPTPPTLAPEPPLGGASTGPPSWPPSDPPAAPLDGRVEPDFASPSFGTSLAEAAASGASTPASRVAARDRIDFADAQFNHAMLAEAGIESSPEDTNSASVLPDEPAAPEFLRQAERQARRERPRHRAALWVLSGLLLGTLALQAALHFRDLLAATVPLARPALEAMCELAACRIEPLRRIDDVVIESSALTSAAGGDAIRLAVVLRNRGALTLAMPSIELTLTDAGGQMLARRALAPADFGVKAAVLAPASEAALQVVLSTGERRASGYTVEPFYP